MTTATKEEPMTAFQLHCNLAAAHHILADLPSPISQEGWETISRAMAHIRGQMSALSTVILWGAE